MVSLSIFAKMLIIIEIVGIILACIYPFIIINIDNYYLSLFIRIIVALTSMGPMVFTVSSLIIFFIIEIWNPELGSNLYQRIFFK